MRSSGGASRSKEATTATPTSRPATCRIQTVGYEAAATYWGVEALDALERSRLSSPWCRSRLDSRRLSEGYLPAPSRAFRRRGDERCRDQRSSLMSRDTWRRTVNPQDLPDGVIEALNVCSQDELQAMDKVGASMEDAKLDLQVRVFAIH